MKSNTHFRFKQFTVAHDRCAHKVGTDGVLLGAWVNIENANHILEIGAGSGVISLMLAQRTRYNVTIDAVEISAPDAKQAAANVLSSPWPERIRVHHMPIQTYQSDFPYDLMVSNPPYFVDSLLPPAEDRSRARHGGELTFSGLVQCTKSLMSPGGRLGIILPETEALQFIAMANANGLHCLRQCSFKSRAHKPVERLLMEFGSAPGTCVTGSLTLYGADDNWSAEYRKLTGDFYLNSR